VVLFLHNRYRRRGGEERAVEDLMWLVREHLGEDVELLERDSALLGRARAAAALARGGLEPDDVARAVRRTGARVVHAHNLTPAFGWRALAAAREAGARVVMHFHNYRLVCAVGICFTAGQECTRCHGRATFPGVLRNCRGSVPEALVYAASLAAWQRRTTRLLDAAIVPSEFARGRLAALGVELPAATVVLPHPVRGVVARSQAAAGRHALLAARLEPEKGLGVAIEACRIACIPLVVAGDGSERARFEGSPGVTFEGHVDDARLAELRAGAAVAVVPSLTGESFGLAAAEALASGVPVAASDIGALPELVPREWLSPPGDAPALAATIARLRGEPAAGERARAQALAVLDPAVLAVTLGRVYS
jgi:glycosyltransferase involved in cell wall biosynthesis